jgi:RNA-directed DNA polymerase
MYKWDEINWRKLERCVFKLQKRIYKAAKQGNTKVVRRLQKLLINSWSAKCLAVRRVTKQSPLTPLNKGGIKGGMAGVDGVKTLSPVARIKLVGRLKIGSKAQPLRRIWIPKPGKTEKRPLGIPTIHDRALQTLAKMALEPEWEAKFEPNSYGFRPGRSCHDAIEAIWVSINKMPKYALDGDIQQCFDRINHKKLLDKLNTSPTLRRQIRAWLKAGVLDGKNLYPTNEGTPQGGTISPLLANIALHGLEMAIKEFAENPPKELKNKFGAIGKKDRLSSLTLVRYADDFVVLHQNIDIIYKCQEIIQEWLNGIGLQIKPEKTQIIHTLNHHNGKKPGFNFLGFNVRQYKVSKYKSGKTQKGYVSSIRPQREKLLAHYKKLAQTIDRLKAAPQEVVIKNLNPIIDGWGQYYRTGVSQKAFNLLDCLLFKKLWQWGVHRHSKKSKGWVKNKYWHTIGQNRWTFCKIYEDGYYLLHRHSRINIRRHTKVKGNASPYDGNFIYWSTRMGRMPGVGKTRTQLLKYQKGKCTHCGLHFLPGDIMEVDHIKPISKGGERSKNNLQLLHKQCHQKKTKTDGSQQIARLTKQGKFINQFPYQWVDDMLIIPSSINDK